MVLPILYLLIIGQKYILNYRRWYQFKVLCLEGKPRFIRRGLKMFKRKENYTDCNFWQYPSLSLLSSKSTALTLWLGARCEYLSVIVNVLCPSSSFTVVKSTPAITSWLANVCLKSWKWKSFMPTLLNKKTLADIINFDYFSI